VLTEDQAMAELTVTPTSTPVRKSSWNCKGLPDMMIDRLKLDWYS